MENLTLPLPLPKQSREGKKPCNLWLGGKTKIDGAKCVRDRYGLSLSEYLERVLKREMSLKRGLLR